MTNETLEKSFVANKRHHSARSPSARMVVSAQDRCLAVYVPTVSDNLPRDARARVLEDKGRRGPQIHFP